MAGASTVSTVAIEADTPHTPTPEDSVAEKFLSRVNFLDMRYGAIHTTGNERKAAASILVYGYKGC